MDADFLPISIKDKKAIDISIAFLSSVEVSKKSVSVGMEDKIIELYVLDQEKDSLLRKEADVCCKSFTIKSSDPFRHEIIGILVRNLENFSQQNLAELKDPLEKIGKKRGAL